MRMRWLYTLLFDVRRGDIAKESNIWAKIKVYIEELLVDERRTLEDVDRSSISFRIDYAEYETKSAGYERATQIR